MGITAFPIVSGAQVVAGGDSTAKQEPGTIMAYRSATDQWALVEYVQAGNSVIERYICAVSNHATLKSYSVRVPVVGDSGSPIRGIAIATIASQKFGFIAIGGYVENALVSSSAAASGEYLRLSGSTAGNLTAINASVFNNGTQGNASAFVVVAVCKGLLTSSAVAGSVQLLGVWG